MTSARSRFLTATGAIAAGATAVAYAAYWKDMKAAKKRLMIDRQVIQSPQGPIEFAESGDGPAVLVIHGAGGGFDQGLDLGRAFLGSGYRVIAPSRFGYLGTPIPADASAEAQADAHLHVLDALKLDRVPVAGVSAGAPSAMQLCLRHPDRCSALALIVPMAYAPDREDGRTLSPFFATVLNMICSSDFLFWAMSKAARPTLIETILGTPVEVYRKATAEERRAVEEMLRSIFPIRRRFAGIWHDSVIASSLTRYALEDIRVPTLVVSAEDDLYGTCASSVYTAQHIRDAKLVTFPRGGHLLVGHEAEVRLHLANLLKEPIESDRRTA